MKPLAVIQFAPTEGPGHFATFARQHSLPTRLYRTGNGELPRSANEFSGLVLMGGPMSAYDDLPWIPKVLDLIRAAVDADAPVLGHCLGGQLMSKALGGEVTRHTMKAIGWCELQVADNPEAAAWFGPGVKHFTGFEWHGDTFTVPEGAVPLLSSPYCRNQGFALGPHLGLQCHIEMDPELVHSWCSTGAQEIAESPGPMVQSTVEIQDNLDSRLAALHKVANRLYTHWSMGLKD